MLQVKKYAILPEVLHRDNQKHKELYMLQYLCLTMLLTLGATTALTQENAPEGTSGSTTLEQRQNSTNPFDELDQLVTDEEHKIKMSNFRKEAAPSYLKVKMTELGVTLALAYIDASEYIKDRYQALALYIRKNYNALLGNKKHGKRKA